MNFFKYQKILTKAIKDVTSSDISYLTKLANQRISRINKSGAKRGSGGRAPFKAPSLKNFINKNAFNFAKKNYLKSLSNFFNLRTGSIRGIKSIIKEFEKRTGIDFSKFSDEQKKSFRNTYDNFKNVFPSFIEEFGSERVMQVIEQHISEFQSTDINDRGNIFLNYT